MLQGGYADVIRAAGAIGSAPEKAGVLLAVLRRGDVEADDLAELLRVTASIATMPEKRDVLKEAASRYPLSNPAVRREFFAAVSGFTTCPERRDVLYAVLAHSPDVETVHAVIGSTREMTSEPERRDVLAEVLDQPRMGAETVRRFVESVREMTDNPIRRDLLIKLMSRTTLGTPELRQVLTAAQEIPSSAEQRDVLVYAAGHQRMDAAAREAYVNAAGVIAGSAERADALSALLGGKAADARPASPSRPSTSAASAAPAARTTRTSTAIHGSYTEDRGLWNSDLVINGNDGRVVRIRSRSVVRDANGQIRRMERGGYLSVEETAAGRTRRVEMSPDGDGFAATYKVNGRTATFEGEGERWMYSILREFTGK
jgi:hypothetical protein